LHDVPSFPTRRSSDLKGVFGWPAIHTRSNEKEESPKLDNIFVDIGAKDKEEVEKLGVHVGCVITYPDEFFIMNKNKFVCRAIDRSEEHTSELQSRENLVCRLLLEK